MNMAHESTLSTEKGIVYVVILPAEMPGSQS